jgi:hypothetical protein
LSSSSSSSSRLHRPSPHLHPRLAHLEYARTAFSERPDTYPQLRRQARHRREFIYNKSLEQKEQQIYDRKQKVKDLLAKGKEVPRGHGVGDREAKMDAGQEGAFLSFSSPVSCSLARIDRCLLSSQFPSPTSTTSTSWPASKTLGFSLRLPATRAASCNSSQRCVPPSFLAVFHECVCGECRTRLVVTVSYGIIDSDSFSPPFPPPFPRFFSTHPRRNSASLSPTRPASIAVTTS